MSQRNDTSPPIIDAIMHVLPDVLSEERWGQIFNQPLTWRPTYDDLVQCHLLLRHDQAGAEAEARRLMEAERWLRPRGKGRPKRTALENQTRQYWLRWIEYRVACQHLLLEIMRKHFPAEYKRKTANYRHAPRSPLNRAIEDVARDVNKSFHTIRAGLKEYRRLERKAER